MACPTPQELAKFPMWVLCGGVPEGLNPRSLRCGVPVPLCMRACACRVPGATTGRGSWYSLLDYVAERALCVESSREGGRARQAFWAPARSTF